jgi:spermidine synthase/uncharacterized membrane protein
MKKHVPKLIGIEFLIFWCGLAGLGLQIVAGRLLTPAFGSSIYTWGSIIGIFMASLSIGYWYGAKHSIHTHESKLQSTILVVAFWFVLLAFFGSFITSLLGQLPLHPNYAALPAVIILFAVPTLLLGSLIPQAVALSNHAHKGTASGRIFFLDTIGSIVGVFLVTFVLIPLLSTPHIFALLVIVCLLSLVRTKLSVGKLTLCLIILGLAILSFINFSQQEIVAEDGEVYILKETLYQRLQVFERNDVRYLYLDGHPQSAMRLNDSFAHVYRYTAYFHLPFLLNENIDSVLFIGGGGFTGPREFAALGYDVDVVELDQDVAQVAVDHFRINESEVDIAVMDGREFLSRTDKKYDLIVIDAYRRSRVPFQMTTVEFYELVYQRLSDEGIIFSNLISSPTGPQSFFYRTSLKTMNEVFPTIYSFGTLESGIMNILLIGTKDEVAYTQEWFYGRAQEVNTPVDLEPRINLMIQNVSTEDVDVLIDEKAPVDSLLANIAAEDFVLE